VADLPVLKGSGRLASPLMGHAHEASDTELTTGGFVRPDGSRAFVYWKHSNLLTTSVTETITFSFAGFDDEPRLVDPMNGAVCEIPKSMRIDNAPGCFTLQHLPLRDYPLFVTFGDFAKFG